MNPAMTIEEFNIFMKAEQSDNLLAQILRKLTTIKKPEDVLLAARGGIGPLATWTGWAF